jgi:phosphoribosylformylglycinamidine synthase
MKYKAIVHVMPRPEILDPQGKATESGLKNLGFSTVSALRVGRRVELEIEAESLEVAHQEVMNAGKKLLANTITEVFHIEVAPLK